MTAEAIVKADLLPTQENERKRASQIAIATMTFYPKFGQEGEDAKLDNMRGRHALDMVRASVAQGHPIIVAEGGSSEAFKKQLSEIQGVDVIDPTKEDEDTRMGGSRRAGYKYASRKEGVKAIAWVEPEKEPLINASFVEAAELVVKGEADIVVPHRTDRRTTGFGSLPPAQRHYEEDYFIPMFRRIVQKFGNVRKVPDLDIPFGPKIFKNDPEILDYFLAKYAFKKKTKHDEVVDPEKWSNTLTLPIAAALMDGKNVVSVDVDYTHPQDMTEFETGNKEFDKKRPDQLRDQMRALVEFCNYYRSGSRIRPVSVQEMIQKEIALKRDELARMFRELQDKPTFQAPGEVHNYQSQSEWYSRAKALAEAGLVIDSGKAPKERFSADEETRPGVVLYPDGNIYRLPLTSVDEGDEYKLDPSKKVAVTGYEYLFLAEKVETKIAELSSQASSK